MNGTVIYPDPKKDIWFFHLPKSIHMVVWLSCERCRCRNHTVVRIRRKLLALPKTQKTKRKRK